MRYQTNGLCMYLLLAALTVTSTTAYITYQSALPHRKQLHWLKKLTVDICESPKLTKEMLETTPDLVAAWSIKRPSKESAIAVESLVKRVIDERRAGNENAITTTSEYNCLLGIWAQSGLGAPAAERCEQILSVMQERYEEGDEHLKPNLTSFKAVLMAWRQVRESYAPYRAQRVLEWMINLYNDGKNDHVLPDADCFDIVLQTWSHSGHKDAPYRAEKTLGAMERLYLATGGLESVKPRTTSFNAVLTSWTRSKEDNAAHRALEILGFMELLHQQGDSFVVPDIKSYSTVMDALQRNYEANNGPKAGALMDRVLQAHHERSIVPETFLFNAAISAWSKTTVTGAYKKSRQLLDKQIKLYKNGCKDCCPDAYGFTSVLAACAAEPGGRNKRSNAFNVALSTYHELLESEEYGGPNHVTYGTMLKACARLLPNKSPLQQKWTEKVFLECKKAGYVGDMALSRLREAASPQLYKELMQGYTRRTIPENWFRNVKEKSEYRRKGPAKRKQAEV